MVVKNHSFKLKEKNQRLFFSEHLQTTEINMFMNVILSEKLNMKLQNKQNNSRK